MVDRQSGVSRERLAPPPEIRTPLRTQQALERLDRLAVKGRLPGFSLYPDSSRFEVALFAEPFDRALVGKIRGDDAAPCRSVEFSLRLKRRVPLLFALVIALTVWPGVVLTDSLIPGAWGWWPTWWWYLPIVVLPLPFIFPRLWKRSEAGAKDHLQEQYQRIRDALEGVPAEKPDEEEFEQVA